MALTICKAVYSKETLVLFGLPVKDALFSNKQVMRWLHPVGDRVSFVTIKVKTKWRSL